MAPVEIDLARSTAAIIIPANDTAVITLTPQAKTGQTVLLQEGESTTLVIKSTKINPDKDTFFELMLEGGITVDPASEGVIAVYPTSASAVLKRGRDSAEIELTAIDDADPEDDEEATISLQLKEGQGAIPAEVAPDTRQITVAIPKNDLYKIGFIGDLVIRKEEESDERGRNISLVVSANTMVAHDIELRIRFASEDFTADGTAIDSTIIMGRQGASFPLIVKNDDLPEPQEKIDITLELVNPSAALAEIDPDRNTATIILSLIHI